MSEAIMIPAIALMIAVYGTGRLLNDGLKRHPGSLPATIATWTIAIIFSGVLCFLGFQVNLAAMTPSSLTP
jgi:hypothetical protein